MRTRRNAGDNGYRSAEDFANEGRGYEPRDNYSDAYRYERDDTDYRGTQNNQVRGHSNVNNNLRSSGYNQGSYDNNGTNWNNSNRRSEWTDHSRSGWNDNGSNWGSNDRRQDSNDYNNYGRIQERGRDRNSYDNGSNLNDQRYRTDRNGFQSNDNGHNGRQNGYGNSWQQDTQRSENFGQRYNDFMEDDDETYGGNRNRYGYDDDISIGNNRSSSRSSGSNGYDRGNEYNGQWNRNSHNGNGASYNDRFENSKTNSGRSPRQGFGQRGK